ncbi:hypothetical protein HS088_TW15G01125 [Tripterygium wilfordii]|uniref:RNase H type-1 domain-containing protein n=1 Tax=Tripterygium wilfordii TaxID=458696 RepID=A0A7J7CNY2_TRIWF|nr:hypothetical protein HS088_TW15G01125 [Tripterygium wilfordii]
MFSCNVGICEPNEAELRALSKALQLTLSYLCRMHLHSSLKLTLSNAFKWAAQQCEAPWKLAQLSNVIALSKLQIGNLSYHHIRRGGNGIADLLAREGIRRSSDFILLC